MPAAFVDASVAAHRALQWRTLWHLSRYSEKTMKPAGASGTGRFPETDYHFHSDSSRWRGYWGPFGDEGAWERKKFYDFTREFLLEAARERAKEMAVFALVVLAAAWPVGYMVVSVVKLLLKGHPLDP